MVLAMTICLAAQAADDESIVLDSGELKLTFSTAGKRLAFQGLSTPGGPEWLDEFGKGSSLWRLAFQGPDGAVKEIGSGDVELSQAKKKQGKAEFAWQARLGDASAEVTTAIRCTKRSRISYWSLRAKLPHGWKVVRSDFPTIPNISLRNGLKLAAPCGWGLEYNIKPGTSYEGTYPSLQLAMQFIAFYANANCLYIGAHDAQANHKHFNVNAREDGIGFFCLNWPALSEKGGGTYDVPYETAIGVLDGGYFEAAQVYREFTFRAPWGKGGPVSKRPIPQWLKDTDLWLMPSPHPIKNVDQCKRASAYFGVPISLHWYNWHVIPFDTLYPDYFPPKPAFGEGVEALQDAGFHVMPYINGRLSDPKSKYWTEEHGDKSAARQENREPYTEVYGSKVPLNVQCPYTAQWQAKVAGIVDRLTNDYGVDGVYIDQIGAAGAVRCFDPDHGHALGGGHMWVDGYRKMLDEARETLPPGRMLTTEENAECWIDQLDALLLVNTPTTPAATPIPLFPAVYSGRTITFGFQYLAWDDLQRSLPFRAKMARAFVWGSQLGWIGVERVTDPAGAKEAEFLRNLARCRRFGHKFLVYGRFLGMLDAGGDNPPVKGEGTGSFGGTYPIDLPAVLASSWQAEDGTIGIALANTSDEEHEVDVRLPGIRASKGLKVAMFGPEGELSVRKTDSAVQKVKVPARSAVILAASP